MSAYFVTAIGTDIGKTFASCALLYAARKAGKKAIGLKPIACGATVSTEGDVAALIDASGATHVLSPFWYSAALSPNMAAAQEGKYIELTDLCAWTRAQIMPNYFTLIEGVGGLMVPLNPHETVRDWMLQLALPAIVIASNYLGALNHTLATVELLRIKNIPIAALIISEAEHGISLAATEATIRNFVPDIPLIVCQPRVSSWHEATAIHALIHELL